MQSMSNNNSVARRFQAVVYLMLAALLPGAGCSDSSSSFAPLSAHEPDPISSSKESDAEHSNWPLFRGDALASGIARTTLPDELSVVWKFTVENGAFEGTPVIVDDVVYIGDLDGSLYALDLNTGDKLWEYKTDSGFYASAALRNGLVYIGDIDGRFYCFDAATGRLKWHYDTQAEIDSSANFYKDSVLVGSQDATLYRLKADTDQPVGELVWKHAIDDQIRCSPTVVDDRAFVAGCDGMLHIIDLTTGEAVAAVEIGAPTVVTPAVSGDWVFFGTEAGVFFSVNWKQAKTEWTYFDEQRGQSLRSSPAVSSTHVVFGSRSKRVYALNPRTGEEVWKFAAKQRIDGSPVIVGNRVFVGAVDGRLYALDLNTGEQTWEYEASGGFVGSPAVASGRLVIASDRGVVYCFGQRDN